MWVVGVVAWCVGTAAIVVGTVMSQPGPADRGVDGLAYLLVGVASVALLGAARWPVVAAGVVTAALVAYIGASYPGGPVLATGLVALYAVGARCSRRVAYGVAAAMAGLVVAVNVVADRGPELIDVLFVGWAAAAVFAADAVRGRREAARLRAEARERAEWERITAERLRIARDLHDSVAHAIATINVQAGMAGRVFDTRPELAREALEVVRTASKSALEELNTMVRVLRAGDAGEPPRSPAPGLADLAALTRSTSQAGVDVTLTVVGPSDVDDRVDGTVAGAAYRIVQEALTNVVRHSGADRAAVTVTRDEAGLRVEVTDEGKAATVPVSPGAGVGLTGMRERAEATGGTLAAGPRPSGGFRVVATWEAAALGGDR